MDDLISRREAIDAIADCTVYGNADDLKEAVMQENAWNKWSGGVLEALEAVEELPSAKPDVIAHGEGELTEQEPCEDAVSREAVTDVIRHSDIFSTWYEMDDTDDIVAEVIDEARKQLVDDVNELPSVTPKCPECDDVVSRRAAIDVAENAFVRGLLASPDIRRLPSVQPERKTGWWMIREGISDAQCSECKMYFIDVYDMDNSDAFCRHCGAKMEGLKVVKDG